MIYPRKSHLLRKAINFSSSGDNTIISADATKAIVIHRLWLACAGATSLTFKDNLSSPAAVSFGALGTLTFDSTDEPWFITDAATAFIINSSVAVQVSGEVYYSLAL